MKCLVVITHPLPASLCHALSRRVVATLEAQGHEVAVEELYAQGFQPALDATERRSYYDGPYRAEAVTDEAARLCEAEALVLLFPTWWFGFPATLKGWFDRVWGPGIAYDHADDLGPIQPRLHRLRRVLAVTTLGSPWWVDWVILRRPVRRVLKWALLATCARNARLQYLSLYRAERLDGGRVERFGERIERALAGWRDG
ncbi:NAD(P)H-dependent oxidoreductase [Endothiovibrio diazotrophicus]